MPKHESCPPTCEVEVNIRLTVHQVNLLAQLVDNFVRDQIDTLALARLANYKDEELIQEVVQQGRELCDLGQKLASTSIAAQNRN